MKYLVILLALAYSNTAQADNMPTPAPIATALTAALTLRLLPEYLPCEFQGNRYACYSLDQQKQLLLLEANAKAWQQQAAAGALALRDRSVEITLLYEQLRLSLSNEQLSKEFLAKQTKELNKTIKEKNDWRAEAETPVIWPYIIGGVIGVLGLGFGVGASLFN